VIGRSGQRRAGDTGRQHGSAYAQVIVPWGRTDAEVTIDEILRRARSELDRVTPAQAWAAMGAGAVLVLTARSPARW